MCWDTGVNFSSLLCHWCAEFECWYVYFFVHGGQAFMATISLPFPHQTMLRDVAKCNKRNCHDDCKYLRIQVSLESHFCHLPTVPNPYPAMFWKYFDALHHVKAFNCRYEKKYASTLCIPYSETKFIRLNTKALSLFLIQEISSKFAYRPVSQFQNKKLCHFWYALFILHWETIGLSTIWCKNVEILFIQQCS